MGALPGFTTQRLVLRARCLDDLDAVCAMDAEPEVMAYIMDGSVPEPVEHREKLAQRLALDHGPGLGIWSVFPREETGRFLGWVALHPLPGGDDIEIGWRFASAHWGHGYATEAAGALMHHGLATLSLPRIVAVLQAANQRSRRVCERLGMSDAGPCRAYGGPCVLYVRERP